MEKVKRFISEKKQVFVIGGGLIILIVAIILFIIISKKENANRQVFIGKVMSLCTEIKEQYKKELEKGNNIHYFSNSIHGIRFQKDNLKYCALVDESGNIYSLEATDGRYFVKTDEKNNSNKVKRSSYKKFECSKKLSVLAKAGYDEKTDNRVNVFGGNIEPHQIEKVSFVPTNKVPKEGLGSFDASEAKDRSVMAWYTDSNKNKLYELYIGAENGVRANEDASYMFAGIYNVKDIDLSYLDTSKSTNMRGMFYYLTSLKKLDLSNLDTSNVTDMSKMFYYVVGVSDLDLMTFDTKSVKDMSNMFNGCWSIAKLNVENFNTENVEDMHSMFENCSKLIDVDLKNFSTKKVKNIKNMFKSCYLLNDDNLHNFIIPNIEKIDGIFCEGQFNKDSKTVKTYTGKRIDALFECK